jgi:hypothetical protein
LKDGLDQAFQGSQSTDVTLKALSDGIAAATRVAK